MTEYVFRPSRRKGGKRVRCRFYSGRYSLARRGRVMTVALDTPDEGVARKRLRDIIVEKQREAEGLDSPKVIREALRTPLADLLQDYRRDLESQHFSAGYIRDTVQRVRRMALEIGWQVLADVRPDSFGLWFAGLAGSAKTKREYQLSVRAFLNWLVRLEMLSQNPLSKLKLVSSRGREVRPYRAYTDDELRSLFALPGERTLFYETLFYSGGRKAEVASLVWRDLTLQPGGRSVAVFRASTTKNREERIVPLHPFLVRELIRSRVGKLDLDSPVFRRVPTRKQLLRDLDTASIEGRDGSGRVVHFHAFRKTARTMAIRCGVSERVCDQVLGHANPNRMGTRYTDVTGLPIQDWTKLPWLGSLSDVDSQRDAQKGEGARSFREVLSELVKLVGVTETEPFTRGIVTLAVAADEWSGRQDSNLRPPGPKPGALPG
jgi:integrase